MRHRNSGSLPDTSAINEQRDTRIPKVNSGSFVLTLKLDFILNHKGLALVVDLLGELGRNGVVGGGIFHHQAHVALHAFEDMWLLHSPGSDIGPVFI